MAAERRTAPRTTGALNKADLDALLAHVRQVPWQVPPEVQLLIKDQEEDFFRLWMFRDGQLTEFTPQV